MPQFTENAIIASFLKLLNEMPLDKITIKTIVDDCGLNRSTFYYYFEDINALLDEVLRRETLKALDPQISIESWQEGIIQGLEFALSNKRAVYHIHKSGGAKRLERYLSAVAGHLMHRFVVSQAEGLNVSEEDIRIVSDVYKYAAVGMLRQWVADDMKRDPKESIRRLGRLLDGNIRTILERADAASAADVQTAATASDK